MNVLAVYDCMLFFMHAARPQRVRETFELVEQRRVTYCLSSDVLAEIQDVLTRPKHQQKFPTLTPSRVAAVVAEITSRCQFVQNVENRYVVARDPKDSKYINLALASGAQYLVTRDKDLLDLMNESLPEGQHFRQTLPQLTILEPAPFVQVVESQVP